MRKRIETTVSCHDCDALPKVPGAGEIVGNNSELQMMHNGVLVRRGGYHGEWMTEIIRRLRGHHEPQEEKAFAAILNSLPDSSTMVEVGSFWAYYSMWFHQKVKEPICVLVEPVIEKLAIGQENFALNGMNGTFINAFIGRYYRPDAEFIDWDGSLHKIPMLSIDQLITDHDLEHIDILHADIQGAEFDMLYGAKHALQEQQIHYLFISTHGCEHQRCLDYLLEQGYHIVAAHTVLESFSGDGLIVAKASKIHGPKEVDISRRKTPWIHRARYHIECIGVQGLKTLRRFRQLDLR
jgi:FkbM family methyltransferase